MKIFTARQIKECDAFTIQREGIVAHALMERAAGKCCEWMQQQFNPRDPILVLCGMGNNGGDGLALTRMLLQEGFSAKAIVLRHTGQFTADASENFKLLHQLAPDNVQILEEGLFVTELPEHIILVDAILGAGLSRPVTGWLASFVAEINELPNTRIAIDIPTGLYADSLPETDAAIIRADHTLSFQFYKRVFLHAEAAPFTGAVHILDIGLSDRFIEDTHSQYHIIDVETISGIYRPRQKFVHKGTFGKAMLIGGSYGKTGAIILSTKAALRTGAGLVFAQAPGCGCQALQASVPEAMFLNAGEDYITRIELPDYPVTMGIGPGMGTHEETQKILHAFISGCDKPVVMDADALNIIATNSEWLNHLPQNSILTPHSREFERLFGPTRDSMLQTELARAKAMKHNIYIVLKGHHTAIVTPEGMCWYNTTGNPGMATGGSGDVLTGILTSLLAQGYTPAEATILGVYLHGLAGDIAAGKLSEEALIAGDIIDHIGSAFLSISNNYR